MAEVTDELTVDVDRDRKVLRGRPFVRRLVALLIVLSWGAMVVPAWQSSLDDVRPHELVADIEAGRVVGYQAVENVRTHPWKFWAGVGSWMADTPATDATGRPVNGFPDETGRRDVGFVRDLIYTTDSGRTRWVSELPGGLPDGRETIGALQASGARPFTAATSPNDRDWPFFPGFLMTILFLGSLLGQSTRWGTKPFWALTATLTAGIGVVAYALRELVAKPPSRWREPRLRWPHGLAIAVVGGLVLPGLLGLLT